MKYHKFKTKGYEIVLTGDEQGISQLMIANNTKPVVIDASWQESSKFFSAAEKQLTEYFEGKRTSFNLKLNPGGTEYQKRVWKTLAKIPYGEIFTYKQVAELTGNAKASRAVGLANNRNPIPIIIPCHRVLGANKKLVGYAYGLEMKKHLIDLERINLVFTKLASYYGDIHRNGWGNRTSWWPAHSAFEMMTGAILTQNTNWGNVEKALNRLGENINPEFILKTPNDELAELIRPSGYHNQKAKKLKALCQWFKKYDFNIEKATAVDKRNLREELLAINGVGGETADSILVYALNKTSFVIDAYTRRIFSRLGFAVPKNYDDFREMLENVVPRAIETYDNYHGLLVEHAKAFCTTTPNCKGCPLREICEKKEVTSQMLLKI